jgi:carbon starvation protein
MSRRSYLLFLSFVWLALVYIIVAFTDVTASSFVGAQTLENGERISGGGIATSSLLYLALPIIMGLLLRYTTLTVGWATLIFLPLVGVSIWLGQLIPFDVGEILRITQPQAQKVWNVALLIYCLIASVVPLWLLLQPRGHLGGYFLYIALAAGMLGVLCGGKSIEYPAFTDWVVTPAGKPPQPLFPLLFITIACGACSGFHSIIASGTTSKQLRNETDARPIGYGAMLLEAMVAIISLSCVMILPKDSPFIAGGPNFLYARGIGTFMSIFGIPAAFGVSFGLMAFTTFVYDTLDVCTRLGRYILQELTGAQGKVGRWVATALTAGVPAIFLLWSPTNAKGEPIWKLFWNLFGASNQLLAALTLLGVTVWLWRTYRKAWVLFVTGIPCVFMYVMSMWALWLTLKPLVLAFQAGNLTTDGPVGNPVPWVAAVLATLGALILIEAIVVLFGSLPRPPAKEQQVAPVPM